MLFVLPPAPPISAITPGPNLNMPLMAESDYTLTCDVSGADNLNPMITYQWTRYDGTTQTQVGSSRTLTLSSVGLSDAGNYTCRATINSALLRDSITISGTQTVMVESELIDLMHTVYLYIDSCSV